MNTAIYCISLVGVVLALNNAEFCVNWILISDLYVSDFKISTRNHDLMIRSAYKHSKDLYVVKLTSHDFIMNRSSALVDFDSVMRIIGQNQYDSIGRLAEIHFINKTPISSDRGPIYYSLSRKGLGYYKLETNTIETTKYLTGKLISTCTNGYCNGIPDLLNSIRNRYGKRHGFLMMPYMSRSQYKIYDVALSFFSSIRKPFIDSHEAFDSFIRFYSKSVLKSSLFIQFSEEKMNKIYSKAFNLAKDLNGFCKSLKGCGFSASYDPEYRGEINLMSSLVIKFKEETMTSSCTKIQLLDKNEKVIDTMGFVHVDYEVIAIPLYFIKSYEAESIRICIGGINETLKIPERYKSFKEND